MKSETKEKGKRDLQPRQSTMKLLGMTSTTIELQIRRIEWRGVCVSSAIAKGKEGARQRSFIGRTGVVEAETGAALPPIITAGLKAKHEGLLDGRFDGCHQTGNERGDEARCGISSATREKAWASDSWALSNRER